MVASAAASLSRGGTRILSGVLHFEHAVVASTDFDESASEQRSVAPHLTQPNWNVRVSGGALADVVAAGADVRGLAIDAAVRAERETNALLEALARGAPVDGARKRDLCALAVEVAHAKEKAADLGVGGLGPASR